MTTQTLSPNQLTTTTPNIYIPQGTLSLTDPEYKSQLRIAIQGSPKSGKSNEAATFPNPIFISYDRGLISMVGRPVHEVPFYDDAFVHKINGERGTNNPFVNRKEALTKWLEIEGRKLTREQTLIFDANTGIQAAYHQWWDYVKLESDNLTSEGNVNFRREWKLKLDYYEHLGVLMKELKCQVIWIFHESPDRNKDGSLNGEVSPLISGQMQDTIQAHFTDWFRSHVWPKSTTEEEFEKAAARFKVSVGVVKEWNLTTPKEHGSFYLWQTQPDNLAKCGTSMLNAPKYVPANYTTFNKYKRKVENASL